MKQTLLSVIVASAVMSAAILLSGCATTSYYTSREQLPADTLFLGPSQQFEATVLSDWQYTPGGNPFRLAPERAFKEEGKTATVMGTYTSGEDVFYVAQYTWEWDQKTYTLFLFAPKAGVDAQLAERQEDARRQAAAADRKRAALASEPVVVSIDGRFKLFVQPRNKKESDSNKQLILEMENQVKNRPVIASFPCDEFQWDAFNRWLTNSYTWIPSESQFEVYYRGDDTADNDYMIVLTQFPPGLNLYVMTYEYFMATH